MKTWYKGDGAMIRFTWYELLWLFFIYSFLGWVLETAAATVKQKKFANRGLVNGPFCVIYGIAALFMTFGLQELNGIWTDISVSRLLLSGVLLDISESAGETDLRS